MSSLNYSRALSQRGLTTRQISTTPALTPEGDRFYYFTCGPEMLEEHLKCICPSAQFVGVGCLNGFKLVFKGRSEVWNASTATPKSIEDEEEDEEEDDEEEEEEYRILGVVWTILQSELYLLDTHDAGLSVIKSVDITTRGQSRLKCRMYEAAAVKNPHDVNDNNNNDKSADGDTDDNDESFGNDHGNNDDSIVCTNESKATSDHSVDSGISNLAITDDDLSSPALEHQQSCTPSTRSTPCTPSAPSAPSTTCDRADSNSETAPLAKPLPSDSYIRLCVAGAIQHDFPPMHLRKLREIPTLSVSPSPGAVGSLALQAVSRLVDSDESSDGDDSDY